MKTLKFMLAAATAIGLVSAYAEPEAGASTTFESLTNGTPVVTGLTDAGGSSGLSYFYYAGANAEDNESVIVAGTPDIARPAGATGDRSKVLQVSTGTDPLLRAFTSFASGAPISSTFTSDVYVDTLVQFTVTPYTDTVTPGADDKLMIYLKEYTNEVGVVAGTNLVVVGGFCVANGNFVAKEYTISGAEIEPNTWHRLTVKAIANFGGLDGYNHPAFEVFLDGDSNPCTFDSAAAAEDVKPADWDDAISGEWTQTESGFVDPFGDGEFAGNELGNCNIVFSLLCDGNADATLQAVGFAGEGKVDDLMITTLDPFFTAVDFTFTAVSGVTAVQTPGTDNWTFTAPEGTVIKSFLVNGNPVAAAVGATSYQWTAASGDAGALVVVSAGKQLTAAEHPWYESPKGFVLAENLPGQTGQIVSSFHGQGQDEYLGNTYSTNPLQFDLYTVDGTNALTSMYSVPAGNVTTPGFRGVAISKALGIAMTLAYDKTTTMYAYPLTAGEPIAVTKPSTHSFDAGAFSPDGKYFFSNALNGESSKNYFVKWSVAMTTNSLTLTKVNSIDAGGRGRSMAYARINGRDLVFGLVDTGKVVVMDMTDETVANWTATDLVTDLPAHSYGTLCVSGVDATGATPKLTVATSYNGASYHGNVLNVYTLTVPAPGAGAVSAALTKSFDEAALTAAFFGDISTGDLYGNTVYVTDDDATIYFARPDQKLYAGIYVPKYDITFISGEGSTTNELSVYEGDTPVAPTAAEVANKTFSAWSPAVAAATADATYTATYNWIAYTITYLNADGTTFTDFMDGYTAPATFTAETPVDLPTAANVDLGEVVGVQFNGWTNETGSVTSTEGLTANLTVFANISAVVAPADWVDPESITPGTSAATQYPDLAGSVLATADAKEVTEWAATNNVDFAAVAAATSGTTYSDAFLLNCAPDAAAVAAEKDDFVLTITFDASGNPVVNLPEGKKYNGTIQLKGKAALTDATWADVPNNTPSSSYKFYKYELSMPSAL